MTETYAPPAFQLYARDWLARSELLTLEQSGALMRLKAHAWLSALHGQPPCSLPGDDTSLARLSGLGPKRKKLGPPLRPMFREEGDRLVDPELLAYRSEIEAKHNKRSAAGRAGNEKRWSETSRSDSQTDRNAIANGSQNTRKQVALHLRTASASASKSGAEADVSSRPAESDADSGSTGAAPPAAPPAPPADAGAAETPANDPPDGGLSSRPDEALVLLNRMPDAKFDDGMTQPRATLTAQGARLKGGEYVRAYSLAHLTWACRAVLDSPPDKAAQLARWVLLKLRDTFAKWRSRDEKHAEHKTAPAIAKLLQPATSVDELGEAYGWLPADVKREIEQAAESRFAGFPKSPAMLRKHSEWIDEQVVERWRGAGSPEPAAHGASSAGGAPMKETVVQFVHDVCVAEDPIDDDTIAKLLELSTNAELQSASSDHSWASQLRCAWSSCNCARG